MEHTRIVMQAELAGPRRESPINGDFVVLDTLGRCDDPSIPAVSVAHHLCPTLCLAQNGLHRAVLVLPGSGVVLFQKLVQPIPLSLRLGKVKLQERGADQGVPPAQPSSAEPERADPLHCEAPGAQSRTFAENRRRSFQPPGLYFSLLQPDRSSNVPPSRPFLTEALARGRSLRIARMTNVERCHGK